MASTWYQEKLKDPRWQRRRLEILQRDDFTCQHCLAEGEGRGRGRRVKMTIKNFVLALDDRSVNSAVVRHFRGAELSEGQLWLLAWLGWRYYGGATYFLLDEVAGIIKIGTSSNVVSRIQDHQRAHPRRLTLLGIIDDTGWQEAAIHKTLRSERFAYGDRQVEWFHWSDLTRSLVERVLREGGFAE